jgi:ATP-dependent DNA helicase
MPTIFRDWDQFESWFDFSDLQDEEGTEQFLQDKMNQDLIKKMHLILQPLLLRRIKADVEHLLPKKREYILYAPLTKDQTDLYNAINDKAIDTRQFLEDKVVERISGGGITPATSLTASPATASKQGDSDSMDIPLSKLDIKNRGRGRPPKSDSSTPKNAFQQMMQNRAFSTSSTASRKRKSKDSLPTPAPKSAKSSRSSTPATSVRGRKISKRKAYTEENSEDEDALSDDEFEAKLVDEMERDPTPITQQDPEEAERARILDLASKFSFIPHPHCKDPNQILTTNRERNLQQKARQPHHATSSRLQLPPQFLQSLVRRPARGRESRVLLRQNASSRPSSPSPFR